MEDQWELARTEIIRFLAEHKRWPRGTAQDVLEERLVTWLIAQKNALANAELSFLRRERLLGLLKAHDAYLAAREKLNFTQE